MMRLRFAKLVTLFVLLVNVILMYYTWRYLFAESSDGAGDAQAKIVSDKSKQRERLQSTNKHIKKAITIVFRDFYHFENDLEHSIESILNLVPSIQILVIFDDEPYPPLAFAANLTAVHANVRFVNMKFDVRKSAAELSPMHQVRTKYVLFVPDSFRFGGRAIIQKMLKEIEREPPRQLEALTVAAPVADRVADGAQSADRQRPAAYSKDPPDKIKLNGKLTSTKIVAVPFASNARTMGNCCSIKLDFANWTMEYSVKNDTNDCDMVSCCALLISFSLAYRRYWMASIASNSHIAPI